MATDAPWERPDTNKKRSASMTSDMATSLLELAFRHADMLEHQMSGYAGLADSGWERVANESGMLCIAAAVSAVRDSKSLDASLATRLESELLETFVGGIEAPFREEVRSALLERADAFSAIMSDWPAERWTEQIGNQFALDCGIFNSSAGKHGAVAFSAVKDEARGAIDAWAKEQHHPESDHPTGPGDATGPHAAGTLIRRMGAHSDAVRGLRDEFEPIYCYYFPRTWTVLLRRWLSRHEPRYALHLQSLADLKARAWHANEESTKTWQAIAVAPLDAPLKAACHLQYELVYYDTVAMITFADFIGAMHRGAADDAARMHGAFREAAAEAQIRLRALARAADVARAHSS